MKIVGVFALFLVVAVSSNHVEEEADLVGDKIPASVVLAAVQSAVEEGGEFFSVDDVVAAVDNSDADLDENPLLRGLIKKCKSGKCRKKCNAQGKNGACVWIKCVCWK